MSYYSSRNTSSFGKVAFSVVLVIAAIIITTYRPFNKASDIRTVTVTVTDKVVKNHDNDSKYLIFTEDENGNIETFEITDSLIYGRFDSSDTYAAIKVNSKYKFKIGGSRNEFLSWYPNIYEYELIEEED